MTTDGGGLHYWGYGSMIIFQSGDNPNLDLHNLQPGTNRSTLNGCGTRQSILNIWVK